MASDLHPDPASGLSSTRQSGDMAGLEPAWLPPPASPALAPDEVHVWRTVLDPAAGAMEAAAQVLSEDERARAGRIVVDRARERFVAGRCFVRTVLGRYLGLPAGQVELAYGPHGRPELAAGLSHRRLIFSLAHSEDRALIALSWDRAVGVDVEYLRPLSDLDGLVGRVFSVAERAEWLGLPPEAKPPAFLRGWTAKEAWLKAKSTGLTWPPDWFSVSLTPGTPLRLVEVQADPDAPAKWELASFEAAPGYVGALAVEGRGLQVGFFDYGSTVSLSSRVLY